MDLIAIMAILEVSFVGFLGDNCLSTIRWLELRAADKGWSAELVPLLNNHMRAEVRCAGLDGRGPCAAADLRRFRSPMQLAADEAFAGWGWAWSRALDRLHFVVLPSPHRLRCACHQLELK